MEAFKVDKWLRAASLAVLAPRCLLCGERGGNGRDLCGNCRDGLPWNRSACSRCAIPLPHPAICGICLQSPPPIAETRAAFVYRFPLDRLVPRFKFHHDLAAGRLLAELMAEGLAGVERPEALIPVPLHATRLRRRGYDQAVELSKALARTLEIPLLVSALSRTRDTAPQSELDASARRRNLNNAFAAPDATALPRHIALIDDVMTTGTTLHAAAKTLRKAGVVRVDAWICARVP
jgi:ComF family protein